MLYVRVSCFVVRGCAVSRRYIIFCNCDMFSVVNVYLDHLKFCVVYIDGRRHVYCSECNVVSNECNEPTSCLVQPLGTHGGEFMYFGCVCFRGEHGVLNCDDICSVSWHRSNMYITVLRISYNPMMGREIIIFFHRCTISLA